MKSTCLLFLLLLTEYTSFSQSTANRWIAPSPTSYSFSRYGEIPVSNYTGVPDISIPLATLKEIDVETSVSISYHGAGIKVDEIASWVGLGWNLNAGGCISRTIRGRPEYPDPVTGTLKPTRADLGFPEPDHDDGTFSNLTFLESARSPIVDIEPDLFSCNFNGKSCKFVFDESGHARMFNHKDWDIKFLPCHPGDPSTSEESKFIITTEDGTKYEFDVRDYILYNYIWVPCAWYLTKIESLTGNSITFEYTSFEAQQYIHSKTSEIAAQNRVVNYYSNEYPTPESNPGRKEQVLTKIKTNNSGWIIFNQNTSQNNKRKDYYNSNNYPLEEIVVYDKNGVPLKCIKTFTSYFIAPVFTNGQFAGQYPYLNLDHLRYRLRLDSLKEYSGDRKTSKPPYKFNYYSEIDPYQYNLPYRLSPNQDHWGYFNNAYNTCLIPKINWTVYASYWMNKIFNLSGSDNYDYSVSEINGGANREPDAEAMKACVLNKIYYPTGGSTEFIFEANEYSYSNNTICGGLRIKSIKNFNELGVKVKEKEYIYKNFDILRKEISSISSGELIDHPNKYYVTIGKVECLNSFRPKPGTDLANDLGNPSSSLCFYNDPQGSYNIIFNISALPTVCLGNAYNNPVGYSTVIVKEQGNGYSVYQYTESYTYPNYTDPDETFDISLNSMNLFQTQYSTIIPSGGWGIPYVMVRQKVRSNDWPYLPPYENEWKRGLLSSVYHYTKDNILIGSQENEYYVENLYNTSGYIVKSLDSPGTEYIHGKYLIPSGWTALKKQIDYEYDATGKINITHEFFYEGAGHKILTTLKTYNSRGESIIKTMRYPKDSPSGINTSAEILNLMIVRNIINPVLKEEVHINGTNFLSGTVNNFKIENNLVRPSDIRIATTNGVYEISEKFNQFDSKGNLIEYYKMADDDNVNLKISYFWGYGNTLPVIKAENIDFATLSAEVSNSLPLVFPRWMLC